MLTLFTLLPLALAWLGCWALARELAARDQIPAGWRWSWLLAQAGWGALVVAIVELASWARSLNATVLWVSWLAVSALLLALAGHLAARRGAGPTSWLPSFASLRSAPFDVKLMAGLCFGIALVLGLIAVLTPCTNYDSLTYHLPRVMHWLQNQSVAHYPTSDTRQLESGPWAGFVLANLCLLAGSDRFVNLAQWWAMLTSAIGASLLAEQLLRPLNATGQSRRRSAPVPGGSDLPTSPRPGFFIAFLFPGWLRPGTGALRDAVAAPLSLDSASLPDAANAALRQRLGALTALLVVTLPTGIVQSITTQNDFVVASWVVCVVVLGLELLRRPGNFTLALGAALALALGILSKVTFLVYTAPFLCAGALVGARNSFRFSFVRLVLLCVAAIALLDGPHLLRNQALFGSPFGSRYMFALQRNADVSLGVVGSNALRNLSLHAATGWEPLTQGLNRLLAGAHRLTGRDLNDRRTTIVNATFAFQTGFPINDNLTGDFHHLLLILLALLTWAFPKARRKCPCRLPLLLAALVGLSFLLFCAYLRWQPWHARFHLPYFLLLLPVAGVTLVLAWSPWPVRTVAGGLFALALVCIGWNRSRPLLTGSEFIFQPREQQYFLQVPRLYVPAAQVAGDIVAAGCQTVGLQARHDFFAGLDELEYPTWVLLRNRGFRGRIYHVGFTNESLGLPTARLADLDAVIAPAATAAEWSRRRPFHTVYEPFAIHWSDRSSRWATLKYAGLDQEQRVADQTFELRLDEGKLGLVLHSGRAGVIRLEGTVSPQSGALPPGSKLLAKSFAGHIRTYPLRGPNFALEVPAPEGATVLLLQLLSPQGDVLTNRRLQQFRWAWRPADGPLPWAYLTRLRAGKGGEAADSSVAFRLGREPLTLEVVAGAAGQVELLVQVVFETGAPANEPRRLLVATPSGQQQMLQVLPGQNLIRAPVLQGTNALTFTWPDAPGTNSARFLGVMDLELRFR